jgi:hypothetical protein
MILQALAIAGNGIATLRNITAVTVVGSAIIDLLN